MTVPQPGTKKLCCSLETICNPYIMQSVVCTSDRDGPLCLILFGTGECECSCLLSTHHKLLSCASLPVCKCFGRISKLLFRTFARTFFASSSALDLFRAYLEAPDPRQTPSCYCTQYKQVSRSRRADLLCCDVRKQASLRCFFETGVQDLLNSPQRSPGSYHEATELCTCLNTYLFWTRKSGRGASGFAFVTSVWSVLLRKGQSYHGSTRQEEPAGTVVLGSVYLAPGCMQAPVEVASRALHILPVNQPSVMPFASLDQRTC